MSHTALVLTGATGLLGSALRAAWRERPLLLLDVEPPPRLHDNERFVQARLGNDATGDVAADVERAAEGAAIGGLVLLAAYYDFSGRPDPRYGQTVQGSLELVDRWPEAPVVNASSLTTLAACEPGQRVSEARLRRQAAWPYPQSKLDLEQGLQERAAGRSIANLIVAGVYTEWCQLVPLYQIVENARWGGPEAVFFPGDPNRGPTYVSLADAARGFARALEWAEQAGPGFEHFLLGEPEPFPYRAARDRALAAFGRRRPLVRLPKWLVRAGASVLDVVSGGRAFVKPWMVEWADLHVAYDVSKAERLLGWRPADRIAARYPALLARARDEADEWRRRNQARPS